MTTKISICMGSSCFARGNVESLGIIENFLKQTNSTATIELIGCRCKNACSEGPNIGINDVVYHNADVGTIIDILKQIIKEKGRK